MKLHELVAHLRSNGKNSSVPRHTEIGNLLAKKICKDLGVPPIR